MKNIEQIYQKWPRINRKMNTWSPQGTQKYSSLISVCT
jgi:hypothetical protein